VFYLSILYHKDKKLYSKISHSHVVNGHAVVCWSDGVTEHCKISNFKLNLRVSGVGCQVSGKKNKTTET
jgi:hypothetical protein